MLPMRMFRSRAFASGNLASLLMFGSLYSAVFFMAQFLETALGDSPLQAGLRLMPWTGTVFIVAPIAGALVDRIGERPLLVAGMLMQAGGFLWVSLLARTGLPFDRMIAPLVLAGVGISTAIPAAQNAALSSVPAAQLGKASGTFGTLRQLGGALGVAIAVAVFGGAGSYGTAASFTDGFGPALVISAALSLGAALAGMAVPGRDGIPAGAAAALGTAGGS